MSVNLMKGYDMGLNYIIQGQNAMTIYYNAQDRKPLVKAISEFTGAKAVYMRTPTYAYRIDYFTVTREGNLEFDDRADSEEIEGLLEFLVGTENTGRGSWLDLSR